MRNDFYSASTHYGNESTHRENLRQLFNTCAIYEPHPTPSALWQAHAMLPWQDGTTGSNVTQWWFEYEAHCQRKDRADAHHVEYSRKQREIGLRLASRMERAMLAEPKRYPGFAKEHDAVRRYYRNVVDTAHVRANLISIGVQISCQIKFAKANGGDDVLLALFIKSMTYEYGRYSTYSNAVAEVVTRLFGKTVADNLDRAVSRLGDKSWTLPLSWRDQTDLVLTDNPLFYLHFPHPAESDPNKLAYTQSVDKLGRWIQTVTKPGRYLAKYYPNADENTIRQLAEKWNVTSHNVLKFVENDDPEGWVHVYRKGPSSCMSSNMSWCVEVYAREGNHLRLAYWETPDGEIVARAIVREGDDSNGRGDKQYVRVYPNTNSSESSATHVAFRTLLESLGYVHGNLDGVEIAKIDHEDGGYVMPYIDTGRNGGQCVEDCGNYWVIGDDGASATNTSGRIYGAVCDHCGESVDDAEDDLTYVESVDQHVCESCLNNDFQYAHGRRYQERFPSEDCVYCESDGEWYVEEYASYHDVYRCAASSDWYHVDDLVCCDVGRYEGEYVHVDSAVQCDVTERWMHEGDSVRTEDGLTIFEDEAEDCAITGDTYCREYLIQVHVNRRITLYYHPDNLTAEVIMSDFVRCGDKLFPKKYVGYALDAVNTEGWEPANVDYPDRGDYSYIEDLLDEHFADEREALEANEYAEAA